MRRCSRAGCPLFLAFFSRKNPFRDAGLVDLAAATSLDMAEKSPACLEEKGGGVVHPIGYIPPLGGGIFLGVSGFLFIP